MPRGVGLDCGGWRELEPGAQLEPQRLAIAAPTLSQAGLLLSAWSPLLALHEGPWGDCFPSRPRAPPPQPRAVHSQAMTAQAAWQLTAG